MQQTAERPTIRLLDGRRMQCKDIPDELVCDVVRRTPAPWPPSPGTVPWRMRWDVQTALEAVTGPLPEKLFLAKISKLFAKKLLNGCDCGCRGDYHLCEECDYAFCCGELPGT